MVLIVDPYFQDLSLIAQFIEFSLHLRRGKADALAYLSDLESSYRLCPHRQLEGSFIIVLQAFIDHSLFYS